MSIIYISESKQNILVMKYVLPFWIEQCIWLSDVHISHNMSHYFQMCVLNFKCATVCHIQSISNVKSSFKDGTQAFNHILVQCGINYAHTHLLLKLQSKVHWNISRCAFIESEFLQHKLNLWALVESHPFTSLNDFNSKV